MNNSKKNKNKLKTPKEVEAPKSKADESKVETESSKDTESLIDKNNFQNYLIGFILIATVIGLFVYAYATSNDNSGPSILTPNNNISLEDGMHAAKLASQEMMAEIKAEMPVLPPMDGPSSSIPDAGQETSAEDSKAVKSNFLNSPTTLLIILSLLTLISISLSFWLYYWRKLSIDGKEIMVPEKFEKNIKSLNKSTKESSSIIQNALDNQAAALNSSRTISDNTNEEIARISEIIVHLQKSIEKKEEEMERFKKGYDADIYHKFLLRFTRVDRVLKEYIDDGTIDLDGLEDIHTQMEDALLECRVESFSPEVGVDYKIQDNIADNPKKIPTTDKEQHEKVEKVVQVGYFRVCEDESIEVISQAKVVIFYYEKPEAIDEPTNGNNIKE
jgi:large-conductance mechanosensitive channel